MAENEKLIKDGETYACVMGNEYSLTITSEDGGPIPEGAIYIFLRRMCLPNEPIYRCKKHYVDGKQNVLESHTANALPAQVKMMANGKYLLGMQWTVGKSLSGREECKISFQCTNYDVSRALLDRRWRVDVRKDANLSQHEILPEFRFVTVHRKLHYARRVFDSFPPPSNTQALAQCNITKTNEVGTQTDQSDPRNSSETCESEAARIMTAFKTQNEKFANLLNQYQSLHQDMLQLRDSISSAGSISGDLFISPQEPLPDISDLSYVDFEELLNM